MAKNRNVVMLAGANGVSFFLHEALLGYGLVGAGNGTRLLAEAATCFLPGHLDHPHRASREPAIDRRTVYFAVSAIVPG
jgi:hypothetical protein